jgi:hypothetical protein
VLDAPIMLSRSLWTMRGPKGSLVTAGIYDVMTGRELRVMRGDDLLESQLSRTGDAALERRAFEIVRFLTRTAGQCWAKAVHEERNRVVPCVGLSWRSRNTTNPSWSVSPVIANHRMRPASIMAW